MTEQPTQTSRATSQQDQPSVWATGFIMFAGVIMTPVLGVGGISGVDPQ